MNDLNIPLFRAEVKDSKFHREDTEKFTELIDGKIYAIGLLCTKGRQIEVTKGDTSTFINIDNSTLAIHFPSMIDGKGNKIFASLDENGKVRDIIENAYNELELLQKENIRLKKQLSKGHHIECGCSFCKPLACSYVDNNFTFTSCDDCRNKIDRTYQEICSNCKRFYGCYFEAKEV